MDELAQLTELCRGLGATPEQAEVMARQMIKRADQLAAERGQKREEAMTIRNILELNAILERSGARWRAIENHVTRMAPEERRRLLGLKVDRNLLTELYARPRA